MDFYELSKKVNELPIRNILEREGVDFHGRGTNLKAKSPFRQTGNIGSFSINTDMNIFHDWKLDIVGGPVKAYMVLYNIPFKDAVIKIAQNNGIDTDYEGRFSRRVEKVVLTVPKVAKKKRDPKLVHEVYSIFLGCSSLNKDDQEYLLGRGLSKKEISELGIKTFPRRTRQFFDTFFTKIRRRFGNEQIIFEVPGFGEENGRLTFPSYSGIVIPIKNPAGIIVGLQIRKKKGEPKYVWLSSSFLKYGSSPGSPPHWMPIQEKRNGLVITEGVFKANTVYRRYNVNVVSVQGVSNWKQLVEQIKEQKDLKGKRVVIAYDSDISKNFGVYSQALKLGNALKSDHNLKYLLWKYTKETKGIDDLLEKENSLSSCFLASYEQLKKRGIKNNGKRK